jgi:arylsulfatase A-like enzyme|eukprot:COSAG06_NODE_2526_length_6722_cov_4.409180_7_plen_34_part_00
MITAVDETVFNVTTSLKQAGLWENTLLIWTTVR